MDRRPTPPIKGDTAMSSLAELRARLRVLATGRVTWMDPDTGVVQADETMSWRDRWAVFGVHSYNWGWIHRYGQRACGCTFNPITRRRVLTDVGCVRHGYRHLLDEPCDQDADGGFENAPGRIVRAVIDALDDALVDRDDVSVEITDGRVVVSW